MSEKLSKIGAIINALRNIGQPKPPVEGTMAATPEAEAISKRLPAALMPRDAIERKRRQLQQLDEQTKEQ